MTDIVDTVWDAIFEAEPRQCDLSATERNKRCLAMSHSTYTQLRACKRDALVNWSIEEEPRYMGFKIEVDETLAPGAIVLRRRRDGT